MLARPNFTVTLSALQRSFAMDALACILLFAFLMRGGDPNWERRNQQCAIYFFVVAVIAILDGQIAARCIETANVMVRKTIIQ